MFDYIFRYVMFINIQFKYRVSLQIIQVKYENSSDKIKGNRRHQVGGF